MRDKHGFSYADYSILANVAYGGLESQKSRSDLKFFRLFSKAKDYNLLFFNDKNEHISVFYPRTDKTLPTIYGFRGTGGIVDTYHDIQIFVPYVCVRISSLLSLNVVQNYITSILIRLYDLTGAMAFKNHMQYETRVLASLNNILNTDAKNLDIDEIFFMEGYHIHSLPISECSEDCALPRRFPSTNVLFVGHSLGGALAKSAGMKYAQSSIVSISGPGRYLSPTEFSNISARTRNVKPNRDLVPMIGV